MIVAFTLPVKPALGLIVALDAIRNALLYVP